MEAYDSKIVSLSSRFCIHMQIFLYREAQLDSLGILTLWFSMQRLGTVPGTWYFLWYHLGQGSKRAEPVLNGGVKTLQTTDGSEELLTRIVTCLPLSNQSCLIVCAPLSPA